MIGALDGCDLHHFDATGRNVVSINKNLKGLKNYEAHEKSTVPVPGTRNDYLLCCACLCGRYGYRNRNGLGYDGNVHAGRI